LQRAQKCDCPYASRRQRHSARRRRCLSDRRAAGYRETDYPGILARDHVRLGYTAAFCPDCKPGDTARVTAIKKAFADSGVLIAQVGARRNMMTPDTAARKANVEYVVQQLQLADELGVKCCVDIAGSFDGSALSGTHPKNLSKEIFAISSTHRSGITTTLPSSKKRFRNPAGGFSRAMPKTFDGPSKST
jgi:hypothetical protein